ncbi:MAG: K(+)/H(+) antiporter NhaP [Nitrospirae bacterium]|nr:MAG: sodium/hydrogen exchanger family protein [Nitrospira sp. OLB3]MBV6471683.1 K(+)/H(+) antiporter NhaP [Nitrospirota bacterium]MCE7965307.1 potassium/proton antiporter [Nitrospira sp. NTP2]MCK6494580.1 potassium/proton antiporter [Nitrospira sp.]MEB2340232.1 potassium/proton antiporter [Nitrospirales bacterium]
MAVTIEYLLLGASGLLLLSVIASKASGRIGVPALLLFLVIGMLAGSDGPGGIHFDNPWLAQSLGVVALTFILFAGGMDTIWSQVKPVLGPGIALSTLGVALTAALVGWFAIAVLDMSWVEGPLIGAIVSSTDAAAVFAVMRSRYVSLRSPLKPLLELESGSNDPMAVFLTLGLITLITGASHSPLELIPMFVRQMTLGAVIGYGAGKLMVLSVNRLRLEYDGLYSVLTLSLVLLTYSGSAWLGGNGFLAVYVAGLMMGNSEFIHKRSLVRFHDGLAWLMQIAMFLTLGLQVFPTQLVPIAGSGLLLALFLMVVARPVAVFVTLVFTKLTFQEKTMVAWVGLRGAVPIILATFPLLAGVPQAGFIFNLVFFIVLTSVLLQGTSIPLVARWLGVDEPWQPRLEASPVWDAPTSLKSGLMEVSVPASSTAIGKRLVDLGLPKSGYVLLIARQGRSFVPDGGTVLEAGDSLLVFADHPSAMRLRSMFHAGHQGGRTVDVSNRRQEEAASRAAL